MIVEKAMNINDIVSKSRDGGILSKDELSFALALKPHSPEAMMLMAEAARVSREASQGKAEVHAQLALNLGPCPGNCIFCSFAAKNGVFTQEVRVSTEDAVSMALQFEKDGANAVFVMTTAHYPFGLVP